MSPISRRLGDAINYIFTMYVLGFYFHSSYHQFNLYIKIESRRNGILCMEFLFNLCFYIARSGIFKCFCRSRYLSTNYLIPLVAKIVMTRN